MIFAVCFLFLNRLMHIFAMMIYWLEDTSSKEEDAWVYGDIYPILVSEYNNLAVLCYLVGLDP